MCELFETREKIRCSSERHVWAIHAYPLQWEAREREREREGQAWARRWLWLNALPEGLSLCECVCLCVCVCAHTQVGDVFQSFIAIEGNLDLTSKSILSHPPVWFSAHAGVCFGCSGCRGCTESRISDLLLVVLPSAAVHIEWMCVGSFKG